MVRTGTTSKTARRFAGPAAQVEFLGEIVDRIVRVAAPERIILFGSAARGEARPDSDLDLLVITTGEVHRGRLTEEIYAALIGAGRAVDVVVVTPEDIVRYRDSPALVIAAALREGREVYAAAA
jgi:predicted nucleotidyltransferase